VSLRHAVEGKKGDVELGIRPTNIGLRSAEQADSHGPRGVVEVIEPMGTETFLSIRVGEAALIVRDEARSEAKVGDEVELVPDIERAHLFDGSTGETIF